MIKISWKVIGAMVAVDAVIIGIVWSIITGVGIWVVVAGLFALAHYFMYRAVASVCGDSKETVLIKNGIRDA